MRRINWFRWLILALFEMAFSCVDPAPSLPLEFHFDLLDATGKSATTFMQGDSITFRFQVTNTADNTVALSNYFSDFCSPSSSFFRVYSVTQTGEQVLDYGRACFPIICTQVGAIRIAPKATLTTQYNWLSTNLECQAKNSPLPKGRFKTGFRQTFTGNGGSYDGVSVDKSFTIEFEVK